MCILHYRYPNGIKKRGYQSNDGYYLLSGGVPFGIYIKKILAPGRVALVVLKLHIGMLFVDVGTMRLGIMMTRVFPIVLTCVVFEFS